MVEDKKRYVQIQQACDCGNDTFELYIAEKPNINGWLRAYCTKCGKEFEGKR